MNTRLTALMAAAALSVPCLFAQENPDNADGRFHGAFIENFDKPGYDNFVERRDRRDEATDFRYFPGSVSSIEKGTDVLMYRIDPNDPAGAGRGPEIISKYYTSYGTYSARIKIPAVKDVQPNIGAVVGYFTYNSEPGKSLSEIDWEWLIADPEIVYIGTWTGYNGQLQRIGRTINLAEGKIYNTIYRSAAGGNIDHPLTGLQNQPETVPAIEGFNAAERFYTYGFDWYPDRLVWWIIHPDTGEKIVLWDYQGSTPDFTGIPDNRTYYRLNFWHTNNWPVETNPNSIEKPAYPFELEVDWMSYKPLDEYMPVVPENAEPVSAEFVFNGYTNHWQNVYQDQYRYGNLFRINIPDIDRTIAQSKRDLAEKLGIPGLDMQEGFFDGLASADYAVAESPDMESIEKAFAVSDNVLVFAETGSEAAVAFAPLNQVVPADITSYQTNTIGYETLDAFILKNGERTLYVAIGPKEDLDIFASVIEGAKEVIGKYDMKRGWFGTATNIQSVTCTPGTPIDVMGRGMNEGNSWFVFSGGYEVHSKDKIPNWVNEVGLPVVTDLGASPLFGCDDWDGFQSQLMGGKDSWMKLREKKHGYLFKSVGPPKGQIDRSNDDDDYDGYFATVGHEKQINASDKPFVLMTGNLLRGTTDCMVLFNPKGENFDKAKMWEAIMDRRSVAVEDGVVMGSDLFRKSVQLMMLDRIYLEEYFGDRVNMTAEVTGTTLHVALTNLYDHYVEGSFSVKLPSQVTMEGSPEQDLCIPPHSTRDVYIELNPSAEAMGRLSAVAASFDWGSSSKTIMAKMDMPLAVSAHQLLYGPASGTGFPVSVYNFTDDTDVTVKISVARKDKPSKTVFFDSRKLEIAKADYETVNFALKLRPGSYIVRTEAMGVVAETQLGIGKESGEVTLKEVDLNGDGVNEYVMENSQVRVTLLTTGARVIEYYVKDKDDNVFFKLWPEKPADYNRPFREWAFWPFGGFEDFLGQASMETHKVYDAEVIKAGGDYAEVRMRAEYYGNVIEKTFSLYGDTPLLGIRFALDMVNPELDILGPQPMVALGQAHGPEDTFIIPEIGGRQEYVMDPERMWGKILDLQEGWNAGYDTEADISFVGAYPVHRPYYLHMWMNLESNPDSNHAYIELQPWLPLYHNSTSYFSYYMWADGGPWEDSLEALRERNLITER